MQDRADRNKVDPVKLGCRKTDAVQCCIAVLKTSLHLRSPSHLASPFLGRFLERSHTVLRSVHRARYANLVVLHILPEVSPTPAKLACDWRTRRPPIPNPCRGSIGVGKRQEGLCSSLALPIPPAIISSNPLRNGDTSGSMMW